MCSVVTNLVTSLQFQPIRCATTLFHFGRPRDVYVATRIILLSSTAEGSAASGYVAKVRPELVETWNGLGNTPSLFQTVVLIDAACNHESFYIIHLIFPYFKLFSDCIIVFIPCMEITLIFFYVIIYYVGAGITTLMSISDGSDRTFFRRKMEKTRSVREEMDGKVFISRQSRHPFPLVNNKIKVLFPICTLIWRVKNYVSRQGKV